MNVKKEKNFELGFFMRVHTGREESSFDNLDIEDMLQNVITGMIRQYDLEKVTIKQKGCDIITYTAKETFQ